MLSPIDTKEGHLVIAVVRDITRRKQAEEAQREYGERLKVLSRRLMEVQESERRSIARELHDEIGQALTGLKLTLEMGARLPPGQIAGCLDQALATVNELMAQARKLSLDLRPGMLDDLGLLPALLWHIEHYTAQTRVRVTFKHSGLEGKRFRPEVETAAYRIVQEALTNIARHACVSEAEVRVWTDNQALAIQVEDRGAGFDLEAVRASSGTSGLAGMRERAMLLGGHLTIESRPGSGTRLTAELNAAKSEK
jgi:signal transduction histidine kinase